MSFALPKLTEVLLRSVNIRAEMHGKDPVPAVDLGFTLTGSNNLLDMLDPGLKAALYRAETEDDDIDPELDGVEPVSDLRVLRASSIRMPIALAREYIGRNLVIDFGLGGKSNIELSGDVNDLRVDAQDGGSVKIDWRFQASGVSDKALGKLGALLKHTINVTLMSSAEADGTQEKLPTSPAPAGAQSPFKFTAPAAGGIVDNNPGDGPSATDIFLERNGAAPAPAEAPAPSAEPAKTEAPKPAAKKAPAKKSAPRKGGEAPSKRGGAK